MPAHRSEDEAAIRADVVAKLRHIRPEARIMHEVNAGGGAVRIDVMAVSRAEIITVEIKSKRDKLDRLANQLEVMRNASHCAIAALDRRFMPEGALERDISFLGVVPEGYSRDDAFAYWWHPRPQDMAEAQLAALEWRVPTDHFALGRSLPEGALDLLHRDELLAACDTCRVSAPRRANMAALSMALRWGATGRDLTKAICHALRTRTLCAEADEPVKTDTEGA